MTEYEEISNFNQELQHKNKQTLSIYKLKQL